jgi:hypothetical protein
VLSIIAKEEVNKYDKSEKVFQFLDSFFDSVQWTNTFSLPHVIYYDEFITPEIIFYFHRYLSKICLDIENIYIIDSHQRGTSLWWENYKEIMQIKSFNFIEIGFEYHEFFELHIGETELNYVQNIDILKEKNILHTFSFYGGTYYSEYRNFLFLLFNYYGNNNPVDKMFDVTDKKSTLDHCEQITNFKNQKMINFIEERWNNDRECYNLITEQKRKYKDHLQFNIDKNCFATVIRETGQEFPWSVITEKTLKCFLHYVVAIPLGYKSVDYLKEYGFWFPDDLIDYSYQYEPFFIDRYIKVFKIIEKLELIKKHQLNKYFIDNIEKFNHNFNNFKKIIVTHRNFYEGHK